MKAVILLGTLKKDELSNTEVLSEFFIDKLKKEKVECEMIKLLDHQIFPGTYSDMGPGDYWPKILAKIKGAKILIFASPVWWGIQSSEMQKVIERLDEMHDILEKTKKSPLDGKIGGIIATGDSDGAEHLIGNIANFWNGIGITLPPYCTLTVLSDKHLKDKPKGRAELLKYYKKEQNDTANTMVKNLIKFAKAF